jgi:hemoglobin
MSQAMMDCGLSPELQARLMQAFEGTADWMRNRPG